MGVVHVFEIVQMLTNRTKLHIWSGRFMTHIDVEDLDRTNNLNQDGEIRKYFVK